MPEDLPPDELTLARARELLATPQGAERELGTDPATRTPIVARSGRYGPYVTEQPAVDASLPKSKQPKPRTASLFPDMTIDSVTLEQALRLLSLLP